LVRVAGKLLVPSANATGIYRAVLVIREGDNTEHRLPIAVGCGKASGSIYRAENAETPVSFTYHLPRKAYVDGVLITVPAGRAYQFRVEVSADENMDGRKWRTVSAERSGWDTVGIPVDEPIKKLRITFDQLIRYGSFEGSDSLVLKRKPEPETKARVIGRWETDRRYITVKKDDAHGGSWIVEIPGTGRSRTDPWSSVTQFLLTEKDRYYTISAYAKIPIQTEISGWAWLGAIGSPKLSPHSFVVFPYVDDQWHRIYLTVKTEPNQELMRVCCSLIDRGLVYFDDVMAIPGTVPTDIPEIIALDMLKKDNKGTWWFVSGED